MATDWKVCGINSRRGKRFLSSPKRPDLPRGPAGLLVNGYRASFPGLKRPMRDVERLTPSVAQVKTEWSHVSSLPVRFLGVGRNISACLLLILIYRGGKTNKRCVGVTKSACWLRDATRHEISWGLKFSQLRY